MRFGVVKGGEVVVLGSVGRVSRVRIPVMLAFGSYTRLSAARMRGVVIAGVFRRGSEST